ncbi:MAG: hypothetical protein QNJ63_28825 [Calothrix sp. MO_192.B10]|nr:hypothetical protein [Calothrix sp. MO_192.B10]
MRGHLITTALAAIIILANPTAVVLSQLPISPASNSSITNVQEVAKIPAPVIEGLELYQAGDIEGAVNKWTDSVLALINDLPTITEEDTQKKETIITLLNKSRPMLSGMLGVLIQDYGKCKGYSVIKSVPHGKNAQSTYLEIKHENGSIFMKFVTLKTDNGWRINQYNFSQNREDILKSN